MFWPILAFIAISLLIFSQKRILGGVLLVLGLSAGGIFLKFEVFDQISHTSQIDQDHLELTNLNLVPRSARSYTFTGRTLNKHKNEIIGFEITIYLKDCIPESSCQVIAQANDFIRLSVPSNQARDFSQNIYFYQDFEITGEMEWKYDVLKIRTRKK